MSNVTIRTFTPFIQELRKEAQELRSRTGKDGVSMSKWVDNCELAKRLDQIANRIEDLADATQYN